MSKPSSAVASPSSSSAVAINVSLFSPPLQSAFSPLVSPTRAGVHQPIVDDVGGHQSASGEGTGLRVSVASSSAGRQLHDRMSQLRIGRSLLSPIDDSAGVMSPSDFSASHTTRSQSADVGSDAEAGEESDTGTDRHYFNDDDEFHAEAQQQTFFTYSPSPDQSQHSSPVLESNDGKQRTHSNSLHLPVASPLIASVYASPAISSTSESSSLDSSSSSSAFAPTAGSMFQSAFSNLNLKGNNTDDGWSNAGVTSTDSSDVQPSTSPALDSVLATPSDLYDESGDFDAANMLADDDEEEDEEDDDDNSQADSKQAGSHDDGEDDAPVFYGSADAPGFTAFQSMMQRKQQGQASKQQQQQPSQANKQIKSAWPRPSQQSQPATPSSSSGIKARTSSKSYDNATAVTTASGKPPLHATSVAPAPSHKSWSSLLKPTISTATSQTSHNHSTETTSTETTPDSGDHDDDEADVAQPQPASQHTGQSNRRPVCVFFLQNLCRYGDHCLNRHEFPDNQCTQCGMLLEGDADAQQQHYDMCSEAAYVAWERSMSWPVECGICYQPTLQINRRFGLLSHCEHAFCLSCIREHRGSLENEPLDESADRACPICSQVSHFVVPCDRLVVDPARKRLIIDDYKQRLKAIPCKHYVNGNCSFSTSCFYRHDPRDKVPNQRHHSVYRRTDTSSSNDHAYSAVKRRGNKDGVWAVSKSMQLSDFLANKLSTKSHASVASQQQRDAG